MARVTAVEVKKWLDDKVPLETIQQRISDDRIKAEKIREIFEGALGNDDPKPTRAAYAKIAALISHLREVGSPDVIINTQEEHFARMTLLAGYLLHEIEAWSDISPHTHPQNGGDEDPFMRVAAILRNCSIRPVKSTPDKLKMGRPVENWRPYGRKIAECLKATLTEAGYRGAKSAINEQSPVAQIGAALIGEIFNVKLEPSGFASQMRARNRSKKKTPTDGDTIPHLPGD